MQNNPARRQFLRTAGAAIATSRFPILGANDRINLGIVGLGGVGRAVAAELASRGHLQAPEPVEGGAPAQRGLLAREHDQTRDR